MITLTKKKKNGGNDSDNGSYAEISKHDNDDDYYDYNDNDTYADTP